MTLTPKGLSVNERHLRIASLACSTFIAPVPMTPNPPALDTLAANSAVAMLAIAP